MDCVCPQIKQQWNNYEPGETPREKVEGVVVAFFLACEDFGRMIDNSFPACAFFSKVELTCAH